MQTKVSVSVETDEEDESYRDALYGALMRKTKMLNGVVLDDTDFRLNLRVVVTDVCLYFEETKRPVKLVASVTSTILVDFHGDNVELLDGHWIFSGFPDEVGELAASIASWFEQHSLQKWIKNAS